MSKTKPQRLTVEFSDGSKKDIEFSKLSNDIRAELSKLAQLPSSAMTPAPQKYLLLEWKDGWVEVMSLEKECTEISKYYVLRRAEDIGRLVITRSGPYPAVKLIGRLPAEISRMSVIDGIQTKTYILNEGNIRAEGGRTEHEYKLDNVNTGPMIDLIGRLKKALGNNDIKAKELLVLNEAQRMDEYDRLRRQIGLRASSTQHDVLAFINMMLQTLAGQ